MKYLHLIWAALFRRKLRTVLTLVSIVTAFLLFGCWTPVRVGSTRPGRAPTAPAPADQLQAQLHPAAARCRWARDRAGRRRGGRTTPTGSAAPTRTRRTRFHLRGGRTTLTLTRDGHAGRSARPLPKPAPGAWWARGAGSASAGRWATACRCSPPSSRQDRQPNWAFDIVGVMRAEGQEDRGLV